MRLPHAPQGRYELAVEYFNKSYNIARASNDAEGLNASRVLFGVAAAHKMLHGVARHVDVNTRPCVERLVDWKNNRADQFDGEIPQPGECCSSNVQRQSEGSFVVRTCVL